MELPWLMLCRRIASLAVADSSRALYCKLLRRDDHQRSLLIGRLGRAERDKEASAHEREVGKESPSSECSCCRAVDISSAQNAEGRNVASENEVETNAAAAIERGSVMPRPDWPSESSVRVRGVIGVLVIVSIACDITLEAAWANFWVWAVGKERSRCKIRGVPSEKRRRFRAA
jgi:hypothetical protein